MLVLDTTGAGLHKRGYRLESGEAPLKETLAAGLVLLSHWNRERPFLDPFCGAGTLAIEAALIGRNRAPGRERSFAAESWPSIAPGIWKRAREEARDQERPPLPELLEASDRDERVIALPVEALRRLRSQATSASCAGPSQRSRTIASTDASSPTLPDGSRIGEEPEVRKSTARCRSLPKASHLVVLRPHRATGFREDRWTGGQPKTKALQRRRGVHLLSVPRTEARTGRGSEAGVRWSRRPRRATGGDFRQPASEAGPPPPEMVFEARDRRLPALRSRHQGSAIRPRPIRRRAPSRSPQATGSRAGPAESTRTGST